MKEKIKKLSGEEFRIIINELIYTYWQFCFNKIGHKEIKEKVYENKIDEENNFKFIWDITLVSLEMSYLLGLSKIFDKEYYEKNRERYYNISFCRAVGCPIESQPELKEHLGTIQKIKQIRDKALTHYDSETMRGPNSSLAEFGLDPKDIESLFVITFGILKKISESFGLVWGLNQVLKETYVQKEFDKWFKIFKETYK